MYMPTSLMRWSTSGAMRLVVMAAGFRYAMSPETKISPWSAISCSALPQLCDGWVLVNEDLVFTFFLTLANKGFKFFVDFEGRGAHFVQRLQQFLRHLPPLLVQRCDELVKQRAATVVDADGGGWASVQQRHTRGCGAVGAAAHRAHALHRRLPQLGNGLADDGQQLGLPRWRARERQQPVVHRRECGGAFARGGVDAGDVVQLDGERCGRAGWQGLEVLLAHADHPRRSLVGLRLGALVSVRQNGLHHRARRVGLQEVQPPPQPLLVRSAGCGLSANDEEVERAASEVVAPKLDLRVALADLELVDFHVDGPPVCPRGRRVGHAVVAQAIEQGRLAHLGVAEEHEHAGAGDGGAGTKVFEVRADGGGATPGDGEGRQLEGVVLHVQVRVAVGSVATTCHALHCEAANLGWQLCQLVDAQVQLPERDEVTDGGRQLRQLVVAHVQIRERGEAADGGGQLCQLVAAHAVVSAVRLPISGGSFVSLLPLTHSVVSLARLPIAAGSSVSWLPPTSSVVSAARLPMAAGSSVSLLPSISSVVSAARLPIVAGSSLSWLSSTFSTVSATRLPIAAGSSASLLSRIINVVRSERLPMAAGSSFSWLLLTCSFVSLVRLPIAAGSSFSLLRLTFSFSSAARLPIEAGSFVSLLPLTSSTLSACSLPIDSGSAVSPLPRKSSSVVPSGTSSLPMSTNAASVRRRCCCGWSSPSSGCAARFISLATRRGAGERLVGRERLRFHDVCNV
eukprot:scaffold48761_cov60-Phaeocystis_antarctica.AAC.1